LTVSTNELVGRYQAAVQRLPGRIERRVRNLTVTPHWVDADRFWYRRETANGHEFVLIDPARAAKEPAFDLQAVAELLSQATGQPAEAAALPFDRFEYVSVEEGSPSHGHIRFELDGQTWQADLTAGTLEPSGQSLPPIFPNFRPHGDIPGLNWGPVLPAPDGRHEVYVQDDDLYLRDRASGQERRLTHDGAPNQGYGQLSGTVWSGEVGLPLNGIPWPVQALWSPDSRLVVTVRIDTREVGRMHLMDSVLDGDYTRRPVVHSWPMVVAGDETIPTATFHVFDAETGERINAQLDPVPAMDAPIAGGSVTWSDDGATLFIRWTARDGRTVPVHRVDARTGASQHLFDETGPTVAWVAPRFLVPIDGLNQFLWISDRDGWHHIYRFDSQTGALINQVTSGDWPVDEILHVDAERGWLYFTARGREEGRDLYYLHLYRCRLDGSELTLLTPEDAEHDVVVSPSGNYFVDRYSKVDLPTVSVLRAADGSFVAELETADISELEALGWTPPERFQALADDGVTSLYGVLYRPSDLDPAGSYPVIDFARQLADWIIAPRSFADGLVGHSGAAVPAQLGFVTVSIDGRGEPGRSQAFYTAADVLGDAEGMRDHIAVLRQLAERYPYLDIERVGVTGYSGGGYTTARAMFLYPDFYKVGVSGAGNHDQRLISAIWGEIYIGMPADQPERWHYQANSSLAANLRGKLLLIHGELDDDTQPANSLQLADALIQAGKEFDFLMVPRMNHIRLHNSLYYRRRLWDYFVRHLMGVEPPDWNRVSFAEEVDPTPLTKL
jgi:dipeptidyl aminopeptidase/acylaminoacyl peptidase